MTICTEDGLIASLLKVTGQHQKESDQKYRFRRRFPRPIEFRVHFDKVDDLSLRGNELGGRAGCLYCLLLLNNHLPTFFSPSKRKTDRHDGEGCSWRSFSMISVSAFCKDFSTNYKADVKGRAWDLKSVNTLYGHGHPTYQFRKTADDKQMTLPLDIQMTDFCINQYRVPQNVRKYQMRKKESIDNLGIK